MVAFFGFLALFLLFTAGMVARIYLTDKKRTLRNATMPNTAGLSTPGARSVLSGSDISDPTAVCRCAIRNIGAHDVTVTPNGAIGWIGSIWTNIPKWTQYLVSVSWDAVPGSGVEFLCSAESRWPTFLSTDSTSAQLTASLVREVTSICRSLSGSMDIP